jgi:hypothetical protein
MTLFSKPKGERSPVPERCHRCATRPGTTRLHSAGVGDDETPAARGRDVWLCEACRRDVGRGLPDN